MSPPASRRAMNLPDAVYDDWTAINVQLMTGARWRLAVVDCDVDEAHDQFRPAMVRHRAGRCWMLVHGVDPTLVSPGAIWVS